MKARQSAQAMGYYEPELRYQKLSACPNCRHVHPLAMKPVPADVSKCPGCGGPAGEEGEVKVEKAVIGGVWGGIANGLTKLGVKLKRFGERVQGNDG